MSEIRLDARGWRDRDDIFAALLPALRAPDWAGPNLDALFDCLSGGILGLSPPLHVRVDHADEAPEAVRAFLARVETVFHDAAREFGHDVRFVWRRDG